MSAYTPEDVYNFADRGDSTSLNTALAISSNRSNWYTTDGGGRNALHEATYNGHFNCICILLNNDINVNSRIKNNSTALSIAAYSGQLQCLELLLARGADINNRNNSNKTALHYAAFGVREACVSLLLNKGAAIDEDGIDSYKPLYTNFTDCRPLIVAEIEHRRMRTAFDAFNHHHIEYPPYIDSIYSLCYPTGDLIVAAPAIGWHEAQRISNNYYFDEVFYYLHMHVAKVCTQSSSNTTSSIIQLATTSDATSTLMTVLVDRLTMYLKPAAL
jgi:hypothetical protein